MIKDCEIIIGDDCSTKKNKTTLLKVLSQYDFPYVEVIQKESHSGSGMAKQTALNRATGDYCLFLDSDDCLVDDPCVIEKLYNGITKYDSVMIMGYTVVRFDTDNITPQYTYEPVIPITKVTSSTAGAMISMSYIKSAKLRFMDTYYCENLPFTTLLIWLLNYNRTLVLHEPTYVRYINDHSVTDFNGFKLAPILEMDNALYGMSVMKDLILKRTVVENRTGILSSQLEAINNTLSRVEVDDKLAEQLIYYYSFLVFKMYEPIIDVLPIKQAPIVRRNIDEFLGGYNIYKIAFIENTWKEFLESEVCKYDFNSRPFLCDRPWNHKPKFLKSNIIT